MSYIIVICQGITVLHHIIESYNKCGRVVHRPYSSCINSIQKLNKNSIKFSLLTRTKSSFKMSQSKSLQKHCVNS